MVNKKIILSVLIIGCIATVAGAGTWAYFTSEATSTDNSFTAGNLNITVTKEIGSHTLLMPGDDISSKYDTTITVFNKGNVPIGNTTMDFDVKNTLGKYLKFGGIRVYDGTDTSGSYTTLLNSGNKDFSSLNDEGCLIYNKLIAPGGSITVKIMNLEFPEDVTDKEAMNATCNLTVTFKGYQQGAPVP